MNKRGQIYILVALVLSIVIFGLVSVSNRAEQENIKSNFEKLSDNYARESSRFVNAMIDSGADNEEISGNFSQFTQLFTAYSKTQSPQFGLIYIFNLDDKLYVGNFLKEELELIDPCVTDDCLLPGCYETIPASVAFDNIGLELGIESEVSKCTNDYTADNFGGTLPETIYFTLGNEDVPYSFEVKEGRPEVIMVSWEVHGNQRKVFTEGDLEEA